MIPLFVSLKVLTQILVIQVTLSDILAKEFSDIDQHYLPLSMIRSLKEDSCIGDKTPYQKHQTRVYYSSLLMNSIHNLWVKVVAHVASTPIQAINLILVRCRLQCIHIFDNLLQGEPYTMPKQVIIILGVIVGEWHDEDVIYAMTDHMRPVNLLVGFDHHIVISPFFSHSIKVWLSNVFAGSVFCFNPLFY